jgi:hypothetical protein
MAARILGFLRLRFTHALRADLALNDRVDRGFSARACLHALFAMAIVNPLAAAGRRAGSGGAWLPAKPRLFQQGRCQGS